MRTEALVGLGTGPQEKSQPQGQADWELGSLLLGVGGTGPEESACGQRATLSLSEARVQRVGWRLSPSAPPRAPAAAQHLCLPGSGLWSMPEFTPMLRPFPKLAVLCTPCKPSSLEASLHTSTGCGEPRPEWALWGRPLPCSFGQK